MRRALFVAAVVAASFLGAAALLDGSEVQAARPCPGATIPCLDYYDPVRCLKPGEGWRSYSNECYAHQDCAIRCERTNN